VSSCEDNPVGGVQYADNYVGASHCADFFVGKISGLESR
jgi:hypothetical protein